MSQIFSKPFLQGSLIATAIHKTQGYTLNFNLYSKNGVFIIAYNLSTSLYLHPIGGKDQLLQFVNEVNHNFTYVNGFTVKDLANVATMAEAKMAFGFSQNTNWTTTTELKTVYNSLIGYIEPEEITNSVTTDAFLIKATKYGLEMSKILQSKGINHPSFDEFSAI